MPIQSYQDWFSKYRAAHNRSRREKYANDPEYREACKAKSREYRVKHANDPEYIEKTRAKSREYQRRVRQEAKLYRFQQEAAAIQ